MARAEAATGGYLLGPGDLAAALGAFKPTTTDAVSICHHLKMLANEKGGKDNITVAVLHMN